MFQNLKVLALAAVVACSVALGAMPSSFAHEGPKGHEGHSSDCCSTHKTPQSPPESEKAVIRQLVDIFHHAIDGEHSHDQTWKQKLLALLKKDTWKQWARGLNPLRLRRHAYRAYHMQKNKEELKEHALNLAMIMPLSHGLEMAAAPIFALGSSALDLPQWIVAGGTSGLSLIAIPGLDPVCMMLFAVYPLRPVHKTLVAVQRKVTYVVRAAQIRLVSQKRRDQIASEGRTDLLRALSTMNDQLQWSEEFVVQVQTQEAAGGQRTVIQISDRTRGRPIAGFSFFEETAQTHASTTVRYLEAVRFGDQWRDEDAANLSQFSKIFHWNVRDAMIESVRVRTGERDPAELRGLFYVQSVTPEGIVFTPRAVHLPNGALRTMEHHSEAIATTCSELLVTSQK